MMGQIFGIQKIWSIIQSK